MSSSNFNYVFKFTRFSFSSSKIFKLGSILEIVSFATEMCIAVGKTSLVD